MPEADFMFVIAIRRKSSASNPSIKEYIENRTLTKVEGDALCSPAIKITNFGDILQESEKVGKGVCSLWMTPHLDLLIKP